jgi:hypothetical protein
MTDERHWVAVARLSRVQHHRLDLAQHGAVRVVDSDQRHVQIGIGEEQLARVQANFARVVLLVQELALGVLPAEHHLRLIGDIGGRQHVAIGQHAELLGVGRPLDQAAGAALLALRIAIDADHRDQAHSLLAALLVAGQQPLVQNRALVVIRVGDFVCRLHSSAVARDFICI